MKVNPDLFPWNRLHMPEQDWQALASAFYSLAHNDFADFEKLPAHLQQHPIGQLCSLFIKTGDHDLVEKAGKALTFTNQWYVYLGRCF